MIFKIFLEITLISIFIGWITYLVLRFNLFKTANKLKEKGDLITTTLNKDNSIDFILNNSLIESLIKKYKVGLATKLVTFIFYFTVLIILDPRDKYFFLAWMLSMGLISFFLSLMSNSKLEDNLKSKLWLFINNLKIDYKEIQALDTIIPQIVNLSNQLSIYFPVNYKIEIQKEVDVQKESIFKNAHLIKEIILDKINLAASDKNYLDKANQLFQGFLNKYNQVSTNVLRTNSLSFIKRLDLLLSLMENAKNNLLVIREWLKFEELVNDLLNELEDLNERAINFIENPILEDENEKKELIDPYIILGADKEMTLEEISKIWKRLLSEFHPDKAENTTESIRKLAEKKAKEINEAFEKIKKERNNSD